MRRLPAHIANEAKKAISDQWRLVLRVIISPNQSAYFGAPGMFPGQRAGIISFGNLEELVNVGVESLGVTAVLKATIELSFFSELRRLAPTFELENTPVELYLFKGEAAPYGYGLGEYGLTPYGSPNPGYFVRIFSGVITSPITWSSGTITITMKDASVFFKEMIPLNRMTVQEYPHLPEVNRGKVKPLVIGAVNGYFPPQIKGPGEGYLTAEVTPQDDQLPVNGDHTLFDPGAQGISSSLKVQLSITDDTATIEYTYNVPEDGFLLVEQEVIKYRGFEHFGGKTLLFNLTRGCYTSSPSSHAQGCQVDFIGIVRIEEELVGYDRIENNRLVCDALPRGSLGTAVAGHAFGVSVIEEGRALEYLLCDAEFGIIESLENVYLGDNHGRRFRVPEEQYELYDAELSPSKANILLFPQPPVVYSPYTTSLQLAMDMAKNSGYEKAADGDLESFCEVFEHQNTFTFWFKASKPFSSDPGRIASVKMCIKYENPSENPLFSPKLFYLSHGGADYHSLSTAPGLHNQKIDITGDAGKTPSSWDWHRDFGSGNSYIEDSVLGPLPVNSICLLADPGAQPKSINDVWFYDENHGYAVCDDGIILHYDGSSWRRMDSPTAHNLTAIDGADPEHIWAVGFGGVVLFYDGTQWVQQDSGVVVNLYDVFAIYNQAGNRYEVHLVGSPSGTPLKPTLLISIDGGESFSDAPRFPSVDTNYANTTFWGIHGATSTFIAAVGGCGAYISWTGNSWSDSRDILHQIWDARGGYEDLFDVFIRYESALEPYEIFLCGSNGFIARGMPSGWVDLGVELGSINNNLKKLYHQDGTHGWAVGEDGVILFYNGSRYAKQQNPMADGSDDLNGVCGVYDSIFGAKVWAVGQNGQILHYDSISGKWSIEADGHSGRFMRIYEVWLEVSYHPAIEEQLDVVVDLKGIKDTDDGEFTQTPAALIENPADVVRFVCKRLIGLKEDQIDEDSLGLARTLYSGWLIGGVIDEQQSGEELLASLSAQTASIIFLEDGRLRMIAPQALVENPTIVMTFDENNILAGSLQGDRTSMDRLINHLTILYDPRYYARNNELYSGEPVLSASRPLRLLSTVELSGFRRFKGIVNSDYDPKALESQRIYRRRKSHILKANLINHPGTAQMLHDVIIGMYSRINHRISFKTSLVGLSLQRGDFIKVRHRDLRHLTPTGTDEAIVVISGIVRRSDHTIEITGEVGG